MRMNIRWSDTGGVLGFVRFLHKPRCFAYHLEARTWYGLPVSIHVGDGCIHRAGVGRLQLPHPPVVNSLLRLGLTTKDRNMLAAYHELGHLESLPWELIYAAMVFIVSLIHGNTSWLEIVLLVASVLAVSEICAELHVINRLKTTSRHYSTYYRDVNRMPCVLFWLMMSVLAVTGIVTAFQ